MNLAAPARRLWAHGSRWRWLVLGALGLAIAACGAVLGPLHNGAFAVPSGLAHVAVAPRPLGDQGAASAIDGAAAGDAGRQPALNAAHGPEGRLIAAYAAVGAGDGRRALEIAASLVTDHPEFALAQLLYGDLLATRAGMPSAFGIDQRGITTPAEDRRLALVDEAQRRLEALRERPPPGRVPAEFALLPSSVTHAIAVDASRSRLYLFKNGPDGLRLERDFYVSVGKQGIAKAVEGDKRTPLGVYWITAALPQSRLDERFGSGALRFNYPNAWDRIQGRTGTGLYLHGVPPSVLNHAPWATDGCVAMANDDIEQLLKTLVVGATPVLIAKQLDWVHPAETQHMAADFRSAFAAWDEARRRSDSVALERWYGRDVPVPSETLKDMAERTELSFIAWRGDASPLMVVTARGAGGISYRQYWMRADGEWRIAFDGAVANGDAMPLRAAVASRGAEGRAGAKSRHRALVDAKKRSNQDSGARRA